MGLRIVGAICLLGFSLGAVANTADRYANFCDNLDGINELRQYAYCAAQPNLYSCGGLMALAVGAPAAVLGSRAMTAVRTTVSQARNRLTGVGEKLAKDYYVRLAAAHAKTLPPGKRTGAHQLTITDRSGVKIPLLGQYDSLEPRAKQALVHQALKEANHPSPIKGMKGLGRSGRRAGVALFGAGPVGTAVAVALEVLTAGNVIASEAYSSYMNLSQDEKPIYELDYRVFSGLMLPDEELLEMLKAKPIGYCGYMMNLHKAIFQKNVNKTWCGADQIVMEIPRERGQPRDVVFKLKGERIKETFHEGHMSAASRYVHKIDPNGEERSLSFSKNLREPLANANGVVKTPTRSIEWIPDRYVDISDGELFNDARRVFNESKLVQELARNCCADPDRGDCRKRFNIQDLKGRNPSVRPPGRSANQ